MSIPVVLYKHAFGLKGDVSKNISYLGDGRVAYPVGNAVVIYTPKQDNNEMSNTQTFLPDRANVVDSTTGITAFASSAKYIAIAERGPDHPTVTLYDLTHGVRKRKVLTVELESKEIVSMAIDRDSRSMVILGGVPDYLLVYWQLDRDKALVSTRACQGSGGETATMCSFHPSPNKQDTICVTGYNNFVRLFKFSKEAAQLKVVGPSKSSNLHKPDTAQNYLCHAWVADDLLLLGTDSGRLALVNGFELTALSLPFEPGRSGEQCAVTSMVAFSAGFAVGTDAGNVIVYEPDTESPPTPDGLPMYVAMKTMPLPKRTTASITHMAVGGPTGATGGGSESDLVVTTDQNQAYLYRDFASHVRADAECQDLSHSFHRATITGMDVCVRKSLVATCSTDRSVRVWDYLENSLELVNFFPEEAHSIALHPSGHQVLVGFSDKLRLMNLLVDNIVTVREIVACRACKEVQFSNGGQFFAAARDTLVHVYNTYTYDLLTTLKGHIERVRSLCWSADDTKILTAGQDGNIFEWDLANISLAGVPTKVELDNNRTGNYSCVVRGPAGSRSAYAVGSDRKLKEFNPGLQDPVRSISTKNTLCTQVAVSAGLMFLGTDKGAVRAVRFPIPPQNPQASTNSVDFNEIALHCGAVTRLRISHDERFLLSAGEDGTLFVLEIQIDYGSDRRLPKEAQPLGEEVLITKAVLKKKKELYQNLAKTLEAERTSWAATLNSSKQEALTLEKQLKSQHQAIWEGLRTENQNLRAEREHLQQMYQTEIEKIKETSRRDAEKHQRDYEDMTRATDRRFELLKETKARQAREREQERAARKAEYEAHKREMHRAHATAMSRKEEELVRLEGIRDKEREDYEKTKALIEEDADEEMQERKHHYSTMIDKRDEAVLKLRGQVGIMHKNWSLLKEKNRTQESRTREAEADVARLEEDKNRHSKRIADLEKEVSERMDTIRDKRERIHELRKKNEELAKFKFVLEYKHKELEKQLQPRDEQISEQVKRINDMDAELEKYWKNNTTLKLTVENLELKVKALEKEILQQEEVLREKHAITARFRTDLHEAMRHLDDAKTLKENMKQLFRKHVTKTVRDAGVDVDVQRDNNRQREYLERSVASLKSKLQKDAQLHRTENARRVQENVVLIKEVNELRREFRVLNAEKEERDKRTEKVVTPRLAPTERVINSAVALPPDVVTRLSRQRDIISRLGARAIELQGGVEDLGFSPRPMTGVSDINSRPTTVHTTTEDGASLPPVTP